MLYLGVKFDAITHDTIVFVFQENRMGFARVKHIAVLIIVIRFLGQVGAVVYLGVKFDAITHDTIVFALQENRMGFARVKHIAVLIIVIRFLGQILDPLWIRRHRQPEKRFKRLTDRL